MYVYYKIGTRSFRLRPPTFLRCKGTSKIRIDEKKRDIFFFIAAPMCLFLGETQAARPERAEAPSPGQHPG